jgi:tetratricopeptide (TPR) repeat protein
MLGDHDNKLGQKAFDLYIKDGIERALQFLDQSIRDKKALPTAYRMRAEFLRRKDRYGEAIASINQAIALEPANSENYVFRAILRVSEPNGFEAAVHDLDKAEELGFPRHLVQWQIAAIRIKQKNYPAAIQSYERASTANADSAGIAKDLAWLRIQMGDLPAAAKGLQAFLDGYLDRQKGELPRVKGEKIVKDDASIKTHPIARHTVQTRVFNSFKEGLEFGERNERAREIAFVFALLGSIQHQLGSYNEALASLKSALDIDRNHDNAFALIGIILMEKDDFNGALANLNSAIKIADVPLYYLKRGIVFTLLKDDLKAKKDFETFLKLNPAGGPDIEAELASEKKKRRLP